MLVQQMICSAFKASLDTLSQSSYGDLKQMELKIGQLYKTISTSLKPLRGILTCITGNKLKPCVFFFLVHSPSYSFIDVNIF